MTIEFDGVNNIIKPSNDAMQIGVSGDTITIPSGATITNNGTATGFGGNDFTGAVTVTTTDTSDTLTLVSTDAGASAGPKLILDRGSASPAADDLIGRISYRSRNSAGEQIDLVKTSCFISDATDGSEDTQFEIDQRVNGTFRNFLTMFSGGIVFNEDSQDIDFRVESENSTDMLRVDAGTDCTIVGANARTDDERFLVHTPNNQKTIVINNANGSYAQDEIRVNCARAGTSSYNFLRMMSGNSADSEFIISGQGDCNADGTFNANGADYAEYFETNDGNNIEVGKTVVLDGNKVRASTEDDTPASIIGVVRPKVDGINSMMIGNTAWNSWTNKYLHDEYGRFIMEDYTVTEWQENETVSYDTDKIPEDVEVPEDAIVKTQQRKKLNPDYDESIEYQPRSKRDEWVIIGMLGQIQVEKGQPVGDRWIKMRDISETIEEWLVR